VRPILALALALTLSCAARHSTTAFRVLPARPDYLLRSPDSKEVPFPEVLSRYTKTGLDWVDLCPQIELRVENAYFREGAPKHGLANFLGTEIARYHVLETGALEQISVESRIDQPPADQPPVQQLLSEPQKRRHYHRFFYQVLLSKKSNVRNAVLLGAESTDELDRMTNQLMSEPESVCGDASSRCTVFPEACTVSLEIAVMVNGARRTVAWGSTLADFAENHRRVELFRGYRNELVPVEVDIRDHETLRVPLLPGDVIKWR
jgi:hypothetical protein